MKLTKHDIAMFLLYNENEKDLSLKGLPETFPASFSNYLVDSESPIEIYRGQICAATFYFTITSNMYQLHTDWSTS